MIRRKFTHIILLMALMLLGYYNTSAQNYPIDGLILKGYGSYVFDDRFDARFDFGRFYDGKIKGGLQWGVGVEYRLDAESGVELLYLRQDTNAPTDYFIEVEPQFTDFDLAMNYVLLSGIRHAQLGAGNIEAFGGIMGGILIADATNPDTRRNDSVTKFSWGLKGGLTFWASDRAGIMLQAQLLSAVQSIGGGLYFGTGGTGAGISSYSTLYQFGLGGGLVFKLN